MEFLYQTDITVDSGLVVNHIQEDVVDPYKKDTLTNNNNPSSSFRDRIQIMELHAVDQQVEQYQHHHQHHEEAATCSLNSWPPPTSSEEENEEEEEREMPVSRKVIHESDRINENDNDNGVEGKEESTNIMNDLYAVDLEADATAAGSSADDKAKDEGEDDNDEEEEDDDTMGVIMGLFHSDCIIDKEATRGIMDGKDMNDMSMNIMKDLHRTDLIVDGGAAAAEVDVECEITFVDPVIPQIMKQHANVNMNMMMDASNHSIQELAALIRTDHDVDGKTEFNVDMTAIVPMLIVDAEMDALDRKREETERPRAKNDIADVQELYDMDQQVDAHGTETETPHSQELEQTHPEPQEYSMPVNLDTSSHNKPPSTIMDELFATDMQMNARSTTRDANDDIMAIMELYDTDCAVNRTKHMPSTDEEDAMIYIELWRVDASVDGIVHENEIEFVDYMTEEIMRQRHEYAQIDVDGNCISAEIVHLWKIDLEVDGCRESQNEMEMFSPMLAIDEEMQKAAEIARGNKAIDNFQDLYEVDVEVERLASETSSCQGIASVVPLPLHTQMEMSSDEYLMPLKGIDCSLHSSGNIDVVMDELYATDVQMDVRTATKETANDVKATMELYEMDRKIAIMQHESLDNAETVYRELMAVDSFVDGVPLNQNETDFVDPIVEKMMIMQKDSVTETGNIHDIINLLHVDHEVDGHKESQSDLHALAPLIAVDSEVDKATTGKNEHQGIEDVQELFAVDVVIDSLTRSQMVSHVDTNLPVQYEDEYHMPVKGLESPLRKDKDSSSVKMMIHDGVSCIMDELYATDEQMNAHANMKDSADDVKLIMELYELDRQIEQSMKPMGINGDEAVYRELMKVDASVDMTSSNQTEYEFVDPMTEKIMHQHHANSQVVSGIHEIVHLLSTDQQVDGCKQYQSDLDEFASMLAIDQQAIDACNNTQEQQGISDVQDLYAVDLEMEQNYVPLAKRISPQPQKHQAPSSSVMDELYATDLEMDSCVNMKKETNDIEAIMELYAIDCSVDRSKSSMDGDGAIFMDLWKNDTIVDGVGSIEVDFVDPMLLHVMKQHQTNLHPYTDMHGVVDLLQTDLEIDGLAQYRREIEPLIPLLAIDCDVKTGQNFADKRYNITEVMDLYAVDIEIDRFTHDFEVVRPEGMIPSDTQKVKDGVSDDHILADGRQNDIGAAGKIQEPKSIPIPPEQNVVGQLFGPGEVSSLLANGIDPNKDLSDYLAFQDLIQNDQGVEEKVPVTQTKPSEKVPEQLSVNSKISEEASTSSTSAQSKEGIKVPRRKIFTDLIHKYSAPLANKHVPTHSTSSSTQLHNNIGESVESIAGDIKKSPPNPNRRKIFPFLKGDY